MCGVQSSLRDVALEAPAAMIAGLASVPCPLEGVVLLQAGSPHLLRAACGASMPCESPES